MENVFFPLIDMKQYARPDSSEDFVVREQLDQMVEMVFFELMARHDIMSTFKDPKLFKSTPAQVSTE